MNVLFSFVCSSRWKISKLVHFSSVFSEWQKKLGRDENVGKTRHKMNQGIFPDSHSLKLKVLWSEVEDIWGLKILWASQLTEKQHGIREKEHLVGKESGQVSFGRYGIISHSNNEKILFQEIILLHSSIVSH